MEKQTNRDIKFRFYGLLDDDDNKTMIYGDNWTFDEYMPINDIFSQVQNDDVKVMQFTGLLDKNGREIYESDIVNQDTKDGIGFYTRTVEHKNNGFVLSGLAYFLQHEIDWTKQLEVVGNIYENGDLL